MLYLPIQLKEKTKQDLQKVFTIDSEGRGTIWVLCVCMVKDLHFVLSANVIGCI
jgi:hypothetical protein